MNAGHDGPGYMRGEEIQKYFHVAGVMNSACRKNGPIKVLRWSEGAGDPFLCILLPVRRQVE